MLRRSSLLLIALALGLFMAACGDDNKSETTTEVSESASATVVLPAHEVAKKDGAKAHSESAIYECSSMDRDGDIGSAAFGGVQDISVMGISCETGRERILDVNKTYDGNAVAPEVDGYECWVIATFRDGLNTIRCATANGKDSFRYTVVPAKKKRIELVSECGTFGRFYDVSVRRQSCQAGATFLDSTPTSQLTGIPEGKTVTVGAQSCTTIYVAGNDRTVNCIQDKKTLRFSIATKPSTSHPKKYVENPQESSDVVEKTKKEPKPATKHGLSPVVTISCTAFGPFDAITAKGINCAAVTTLLTQSETKVEAMERGADPLVIGASYSCVRIDSGGQTATAQCTSPTSGASFRASFIAPSAQPPANGNPPATTTPASAPAGGSAAPDTTTTTTPDASTSSPDAAVTSTPESSDADAGSAP
jgi:hypothetical protein